MIYGLSVISTSGFPYYNKDFAVEPRNSTLKMLFFDYSKALVQHCQEDQFELVAGLVSALFNFSGAQNRPINELTYTRPEFEIHHLLDGQQDGAGKQGTFITVRCEPYCIKESIKKKLDYIYTTIIEPLEPLSEKSRLAPSEEKTIADVFLDAAAKQAVRSRSKAIDACLKPFIKEYASYGVKAVAIASSNLTILKVVGSTTEEMQGVLRMVECPVVEPLSWKFRQAWTTDNVQITLVFVNSAFNIVVSPQLKEPLYYIMLCDAYSTVGELPRKLLIDVNRVLE